MRFFDCGTTEEKRCQIITAALTLFVAGHQVLQEPDGDLLVLRQGHLHVHDEEVVDLALAPELGAELHGCGRDGHLGLLPDGGGDGLLGLLVVDVVALHVKFYN